jgi:release factor glutamine methyltransferase
MSTDQPWTIGRLLEWTTRYLADKGIESPRLETQILLAHAMGCKRIQLYARFDELVEEPHRQKFRELIGRRLKGCPVAYLVGTKEFFSLELEVTPAVLIPRPDSECLVDACLRLAKDQAAPCVLDVGTGSGCLAVAIAWHNKKAQVTAIDISAEALAVAARNAARHGVAPRVQFLEGDLFGPLPGDAQFDLIVSNPPYVPHGDIPELEQTVRDFEPHLALDGGPDGFDVFGRLVAGAGSFLREGGWLLIEIGAAQEQEARRRVESQSGFELAPTLRDGAGQPRALRAWWRLPTGN